MDHASELEVVPLSSGIDDIDNLNKPKSHPFASPAFSANNHKKIPIVVDLKNVIHKLQNGKHHNGHKYEKNDIKDEEELIQIPSKSASLSSIESPSRKSHNLLKIIAPSMAFFGCQFAWACQGGYVDPYLRELGLPNDMMNYAWILGPISGIYYPCTLIA